MTRLGRPPRPPEDRFFPRVQPDEAGCWMWQGGTDRAGYGYFWNGARQVKAHRWAYEFMVGEIPAGLQLDHLCRRPSCVNPEHLEPVTARINTLRGEGITAQHARRVRCPRGHEYSQDGGSRLCRTCRRETYRRYRAKKRTLT